MINVGIAELNVATGTETLATYALGSCVGVCLYDAEKRIAGLVHIMLPWSKESPVSTDNGCRFADSGITMLIQKMYEKGARKSRLTAKIAGGAQMFGNSAIFNIGERNVEAVKKVLAAYNIPIAAEETGSNFGRTVFFHAEDGIMEVRAAMKPVLKV